MRVSGEGWKFIDNDDPATNTPILAFRKGSTHDEIQLTEEQAEVFKQHA